MLSLYDGIAVSVAILLICYHFYHQSLNQPSLPPGPPSEPFLGHLRIIPRDAPPEWTYHKWAKLYGDIICLRILGRPIIILNSLQSATDLLDRRGSIYSDRPKYTQFELMGWEDSVTFLQWGSRQRMHRNLISSYLTKSKVVDFQDVQYSEALKLINKLTDEPEKFTESLAGYATAIIMKITFGYTVSSHDDEYVKLVKAAEYGINHCGTTPGTSTIDFFPWLRHLPSWLRRSSSLDYALSWTHATRQAHDVPYEFVRESIAHGNASHSFMQQCLEELSKSEEKDAARVKYPDLQLRDVKGLAGTFSAAGEATTSSTLSVFILCMVLNPDVQRKAQDEIDSVIGPDRLPQFSDRSALPYVEHVLQEVYRWHPVLPLGVPHRTTQADVYKDMFIPKGSFVIANAMSMCYDEAIYKDPHFFNPSRYVAKEDGGAGEPYPKAQFGFGRRICPGRYLADSSLWIAVAHILATLTISPELGADGSAVMPDIVYSIGLTSHPEPFKCNIRRRSECKNETIADARELRAPAYLSTAKHFG